MRKVVLPLLLLAAVMAGCTSIDCSMNSNVAGVYRFMSQSGDSLKLTNRYITISSARSIDGSDTVLINRQLNACTLRLPVSYANDADQLYVLLQDTALHSMAKDTITLTKTNEPVFESVDCAPRYNHTAKSVSCTHNFIESIVINNNKIDNDLTKVNFYLYIKPVYLQ